MGHREALLEGSIACLQEKGYAGTTARDIVEASGTNLGSIGYHYGSKEALLDQALVEAVRRWFEPLIVLAAGVGPGNIPERIGAGIVGLFESLPRNRPLVIAYFEALVRAQRNEALKAQLAAGYDELRLTLVENLGSALTDGQRESALTAETLAAVILALADGLVVQWIIDPSRLPDAEQVAHAAEEAFTGLAGRYADS